jgi:hypothetical protein
MALFLVLVPGKKDADQKMFGGVGSGREKPWLDIYIRD